MSLNKARRLACTWLLAATAAAVAGAALARPEELLPPLSARQIEARMKTLLRDMAELGAYIESVEDDGTIVLKQMSSTPSACGTSTPKPTLGKPVDKEKLALAERALEQLDSDLAGGVKTRFRTAQTSCVQGKPQ